MVKNPLQRKGLTVRQALFIFFIFSKDFFLKNNHSDDATDEHQ